jgi:hypothetical protein
MKRLASNLILVLLLMGCTTTEFPGVQQITKIVTGDLTNLPSQQKSFAWYPSENNAFLPANENRDLVMTNTETSITKIMQEKGYNLVQIEQNPDFLIGYGLALESHLSDDEIFGKVGMVVGLSIEGVDKDRFQKGTALVALYLPGDDMPKWRVLAQGFTDTNKSKQHRKDNIYAVMLSMLSPIPAAQTQ